MMNTIYPNEGAQLHVNGAEAKPGTNMEGLLLSSRGPVEYLVQVVRHTGRVIKRKIQLIFGSISIVESKVQGEKK